MRKAIIAVLAAAVMLLAVSCGMGMFDSSIVGTWTAQTDRRSMRYSFYEDGTFRYLLKDSRTGAEITDISGTWEINGEGRLHMNAPISIYVPRYDEDLARYALIYTGEPKVMCFSGASDPDYIDLSFCKPYTVEAENSYSYKDSTESDQYGVHMTNETTRLFEFDPENGKCVMTVTEEMDYENGTYCKSIKKYNFIAESLDIESFIAYKLYNDMMFSEEEILDYTISGETLLLGNMNILLTRQ
ncbi:MAG: hypothetical protein II753_05005 [Spirochaetales bacterium]|nr:hypothetical protein [Spirochaetales bacterium]